MEKRDVSAGAFDLLRSESKPQGMLDSRASKASVFRIVARDSDVWGCGSSGDVMKPLLADGQGEPPAGELLVPQAVVEVQLRSTKLITRCETGQVAR